MPDDNTTDESQPTDGSSANRSSASGASQTAAETMRVIDANANRAAEGMRVVEEYLRFIVEDPALCESAKSMRHRLTEILSDVALERCWQYRDADEDIGAAITTRGEHIRSDSTAVVKASLKRAEQAIRCLEEYSKTLSVDAAIQFESLRYAAYQLERQVLQLLDSRVQLSDCSIYVLVDGTESEESFLKRIGGVIAGGADAVQLRDKRLSDRELLARAILLRESTRGRCLFIMNDRVDLALASGADGVHLGQEEMPIGPARRMLGAKTHNSAQVRQAVSDGASYLGCGPTFPSSTKSFDEFPGPKFLQQVLKSTAMPFFAIGGVDETNLASLVEIGVRRIAVRSAVWNASSPASAIARLRRILKNATNESPVVEANS